MQPTKIIPFRRAERPLQLLIDSPHVSSFPRFAREARNTAVVPPVLVPTGPQGAK